LIISFNNSLEPERCRHQHVLRDFGVDVRSGYTEPTSSSYIHIRYAEFKAVIEIPSGNLLDGDLPGKQMKLVQAWIALHSDELMADWIMAAAGETPYKIEPLR